MEEAKKCSKCGVEKLLGEFSKRRTSSDGRRSQCSMCERAAAKKFHRENGEKIRARQRTQYRENIEAVRERNARWRRENPETQRGWRQNNRDKEGAIARRCRERYPEKHKARAAVNHAIIAGRLTRPKVCSNCPTTENIQGHHEDYSKPLEVIWLCIQCHRKADALLKEKKEETSC